MLREISTDDRVQSFAPAVAQVEPLHTIQGAAVCQLPALATVLLIFEPRQQVNGSVKPF
jgi:hypothetical protein